MLGYFRQYQSVFGDALNKMRDLNHLIGIQSRRIGRYAHDVDDHWYLTIGPSGIETSRHGGDADLVVTGTATDLYLLMWNRTDESTVQLVGDAEVMGLWREACRVRWSGGE